jgi:hypothetical protein
MLHALQHTGTTMDMCWNVRIGTGPDDLKLVHSTPISIPANLPRKAAEDLLRAYETESGNHGEDA